MANESTVIVKYKADKSSVQKTEQAGAKLIKQQQALGKAATEVSKAAAKESRALADVDARRLDKVADAQRDIAKATQKATAAQRDYNDAFDQTSKNVALAGDVESNLRAVGGAAGAAGLGGVGGGIGAAAEIPALVEALPRLKESLAGLPSAAKAAASSIGIGGGALIGAIGGLAIAFSLLTKEASRAKQEIIAQGDAEREWQEFIAIATPAEIRARRAANDEQLQIERGLNAERIADSQRLAGELTAAQRNWRGVGISLGTTSGELDGANALWKESASSINHLTEENKKLDAALGQLGNTTTTTTLQLAQDTATRVQLEQELAGLGAEAAQARLQSMQNEKAVIEAQIAVLQASGDASEEVVNQLSQLEQQLRSLDGSIAQVQSHISSGAAKTVDSAAAQEQAQEKAAQAAEQAGQRIQQAHQQYADAVDNINRQTSQSIADANRKNKQSLKDMEKALGEDMVEAVADANRERLGAERDYYRDEQKEARANQRELKNLRRDALRSEKDAIRSRDFLALGELAERTKEEVDDAKEGFLAERKEREIALGFAMSDMKQAQGQQRIERLKDYQKQQRDLQMNLKRQIADIYRGESRQLEAAARARDKQLQIAQQGMSGLLKIEARLWEERNRMAGGGGRTNRSTFAGGDDTLETLYAVGIGG